MNDYRYEMTDPRRGGVLVISLLMVAFAVIGAAAAARYCLHESGLSKHSAARVQALHTAEAGVELAMYAFNRQQQSGDGWTGWTQVSNGVYALTRTLDGMPVTPTSDSSFRVQADTNTMTITSRGSADVPRFVNPAARTLAVALELRDIPLRSPFEWGMVSKDQLNITGNPYLDSYDSRNGPYGGSNISTNSNIGSTGVRADAIRGGGATQVFGDAAVGPDGDIIANPAPFWSGTLQRDLVVDFPDVFVPRTDITEADAITKSDEINVAGDTYIGVTEVNLKNGTLEIKGDGELTMYVSGTFDINTSAELLYSPSAGGNIRMKIFINGDANIKGELNTDGIPENLQLFGTPNCTSIDSQANNKKSMIIYAPQAEIALSGNAVIQGAIVGENIRVTGNFDFRYDEALAEIDLPVDPNRPQEYVLKNWMEL